MKFFIIAASKDHVEIGKEIGIAQAGHGKRNNLDKLRRGDWIVYYSSRDRLKDGKPCQKFTAIGQVMDTEAYQVTVNENFKSWRRKVKYQEATATPIKPLVEKLEFIKNKRKWGFYLMSGFVEIPRKDFEVIASNLLGSPSVSIL